MITCMISGALSKSPETRTSKTGNPYTTATVRTGEGEDSLFCSVTCFGDLAGTLAGLAKGDAITVIGTGKVSTYTGKEGDTRAGLSITANRIIALMDLQVPPKAPRSKGTGQRRRTDPHPVGPPGPRQDLPPVPPVPPIEAYDDPIPF